jgi:hypothetical protein
MFFSVLSGHPGLNAVLPLCIWVIPPLKIEAGIGPEPARKGRLIMLEAAVDEDTPATGALDRSDCSVSVLNFVFCLY